MHYGRKSHKATILEKKFEFQQNTVNAWILSKQYNVFVSKNYVQCAF